MPAHHHHIRLPRSLATSEARKALPQLVNELVEIAEPGATLEAHAVEIGPRNRGGVWIVPAIDAEAAIDREHKLRKRLSEYEEILEDLALGQVIKERLSKPSRGKISGTDFTRELGFSEVADSIDGPSKVAKYRVDVHDEVRNVDVPAFIEGLSSKDEELD